MPSDGEYLSYFKDQLQKDDRLMGDAGQLEEIEAVTRRGSVSGYHNQALLATNAITASFANRPVDKFSILSGLTHTVQFVNLIAFYLNILLPYNIPHK
jgi:hypothetical protein